MNDMEFIAGDFLHGDLPSDKDYLGHYFKGEIERAFLSYYFTFPDLYKEGDFMPFYNGFCEHTGHSCSTRWVRKLLVKLTLVQKELKDAERNFNLIRVGEIKSGKALFR
jgi:hypothetical protein